MDSYIMQPTASQKNRALSLLNLTPFWKTKTRRRTCKVRASLVAQLVKNLPAMQEALVQLLGQEDPLEKGEATHSSILGLPWWLRW